MARPIYLGVNIDHVATLRQARRTTYPSILDAAGAAERGGADGITVHLREDRRHIQDGDVDQLRIHIATKLNLEMAATEEMVRNACRLRPQDACIVPEKRAELTTEGGLDAAGQIETMSRVVSALRDAGIRVSLFIDPDERQIEATMRLGADAIEIHTGKYADATAAVERAVELRRIQSAAQRAAAAGLIVNAGHGLNLANVDAIAAIPEIHELNIGHSLVAHALFVGLEQAVREMKALMVAARSR
ncbi:MAG: pyridoxine 5'-phosphate synthase [Deltaproteobacteria bacterium]|nr:pyridoxine 5'-phosphate synthase [Deltaproteobacteria bacterium]MBI3390285.1 pyridoxine 5'-phosphate synthase [Deltaproteobacteria bacterium]